MGAAATLDARVARRRVEKSIGGESLKFEEKMEGEVEEGIFRCSCFLVGRLGDV